MKLSNRLTKVPVYIFSRIDKIKTELKANGIDIIDLGVGDPDIPTPKFITNAMQKSILDVKNYRYPPYEGIMEFKKAVADYYRRNFNVKLDSNKEIAVLIGSKEGIAHLFLALTDPGDYVLVPDPGYPVYNSASIIAGCIPYTMPLCEKNNYIPVLKNIYPEVAKKSKLLIVNYPNNPTGAVATKDFFSSLVKFGKDNDLVVVNDGAYIEFFGEKESKVSLLQTDEALENCVEFGTLSKSYNMTGWRLGYIAGNSEVIERLMVVKTNFDSGQFAAIQEAGIEALNYGDYFIEFMREIYNERRDIVHKTLNKKGLHVYNGKGAFYVWFKVPSNFKSQEFASFILEETGVIVTPGDTFGSIGEGYCRISLTVDTEKIKKAMERISVLNI